MGQGLEDSNRAGANAGAGVVSWPGQGCLELGPVVGSFNRTSLAAFPDLRGPGFWRLLLDLVFFLASDPVDFFLPAGAEPGVRVGGIAVASGRAVLVDPGLGASDVGKTVGWEDLCALVRAAAGSKARLLILTSAWTTEAEGFLKGSAAGGRGWVLGSGGLGITGLFWIDFTRGRENLAGAGWEVGGTGFSVAGADFVKEG